VFALLLAVLLGAGSSASAQTPAGPVSASSPATKKELVRDPAAVQSIEVTSVDFTKVEKVVASRLSVFGVALGDSVRDAMRLVAGPWWLGRVWVPHPFGVWFTKGCGF